MSDMWTSIKYRPLTMIEEVIKYAEDPQHNGAAYEIEVKTADYWYEGTVLSYGPDTVGLKAAGNKVIFLDTRDALFIKVHFQ